MGVPLNHTKRCSKADNVLGQGTQVKGMGQC